MGMFMPFLRTAEISGSSRHSDFGSQVLFPRYPGFVRRVTQDEKAAIRAQVQEMIESGEIEL